MGYDFIIEPTDYQAFDNEDEQIERCQEWGLMSRKAAKAKTFHYRGHGVNLPCRVVGAADEMTAVIEFENGQKHCIHPSYLKEMQASSFGQRFAVAGETPTAAAAGGDETQRAHAAGAISTEAADVIEPDGSGVVDAAGAEGADPAEPQPAESAGAGETRRTEAADVIEPDGSGVVDAARAEGADAAEPSDDQPAADAPKPDVKEPTTPAKGKAKKEKPKKPQLPEGKVRMTVTVSDFTTIPNNFSDNDDEVVVYDEVTIEEPETEIGVAWSSHSATLKKLELEVGDKLTFEAKIIKKKLTRHPVPYKINNPSKIQKL
ncbi:hypothetical protein [Paenibacillus xerothermodurans]|uniref:Uncharacterized protein n=1 Tax=Paenibacillus xerothermodurans TaxID=1977292 RepID=A0A2W1NAQ3_PAEXE|nr:hypothetical protein [Paenibacillus xerothermodurans]PZE20291.1 hypothetical protein CBW46_014170 [Paenibacillus xerothermodurans]